MLLHFQRNMQLKRFLLHLKMNDAIAQHCRSTVKRRIGVQTGTKADGTPAIQEVEMRYRPTLEALIPNENRRAPFA